MEDSKATQKLIPVYRCKYCATTFVKAEALIAHKKQNHLVEIIKAKKQRLQTESVVKEEKTLDVPPQDSIPIAIKNPTLATNSRDDSQTVDWELHQHSSNSSSVNEVAEDNSDGERHCYEAVAKSSDPGIFSFKSRAFESAVSNLKANNEGFQCPVCDDTFNYDYQLVHHMTSHSLQPQGKAKEEELAEDEDEEAEDYYDELAEDDEDKLTEDDGDKVAEDDEDKVEEIDEHKGEELDKEKEANFDDAKEGTDHDNELKHEDEYSHCIYPLSSPTEIPLTPKVLEKSTSHGKSRRRRSIWGSTRFRCKHCPRSFPRSRQLMLHISNEHIEVSLQPSAVIKEEPKSPSSTTSTQVYSSECKTEQLSSKRHKCRGCAFTTEFRSSLNRHERLHPQLHQPQHKCSHCSLLFHNRMSRLNHENAVHHASSSFKKIEDPIFIMMKDIEVADPHTHSKNATFGKGYRCRHCGRYSISRQRLRAHLKVVHGPKRFQCDYCPYSSGTKICVRIHTERLHQNKYGTEHQCEYCGATCFSNGHLKQHIQSVHEDVKVNANESFTFISADKNNSPTTSIDCGDEKLKRKVCNKQCNDVNCPYIGQIGALIRHVNNVHLQKHRYKCKLCTASYAILCHFNVHKQMHKAQSKSNIRETLTPMRNLTSSMKSTQLRSKVSTMYRASESSEEIDESTIEGLGNMDSTFGDEERALNIPKNKTHIVGPRQHKYRCQLCEDSYKTKKSLYRHYGSQYHRYNESLRNLGTGKRKINRQNVWRKIECKACSKMFQTKDKLLIHMELNHGIMSVERDEVMYEPNDSVPKVKYQSTTNMNRYYDYKRPRMSSMESGDMVEYDRPQNSAASQQTKAFEEPSSTSVEMRSKKTTVTVTHESSFGLKITTVKFGK